MCFVQLHLCVLVAKFSDLDFIFQCTNLFLFDPLFKAMLNQTFSSMQLNVYFFVYLTVKEGFPKKAFKVEEDHNRYKCPLKGCNKGKGHNRYKCPLKGCNKGKGL